MATRRPQPIAIANRRNRHSQLYIVDHNRSPQADSILSFGRNGAGISRRSGHLAEVVMIPDASADDLNPALEFGPLTPCPVSNGESGWPITSAESEDGSGCLQP